MLTVGLAVGLLLAVIAVLFIVRRCLRYVFYCASICRFHIPAFQASIDRQISRHVGLSVRAGASIASPQA